MTMTIEQLMNYTTDETPTMNDVDLIDRIMYDGDMSGLFATFDGPPSTPNEILFNEGLKQFIQVTCLDDEYQEAAQERNTTTQCQDGSWW